MLASHEEWTQTYKQSISAAYARFTNFLRIPFDKPKYRPVEKLPFIPTEKEIDQLIAACGFRTSTFLTILKETGIRSGEAAKITWNNIDFKRKTIKIVPQKHGRARELKISETLITMLKKLPKKSNLLFYAKVQTIRATFARQRKRLALKIDNPRLDQLHFH